MIRRENSQGFEFCDIYIYIYVYIDIDIDIPSSAKST